MWVMSLKSEYVKYVYEMSLRSEYEMSLKNVYDMSLKSDGMS